MGRFFAKASLVWLVVLFLVAPAVFAADVSKITEPLNRIYDLVKLVISVVAVLALCFAGSKFMFSGDNIQAREGAKAMVGYIVVGLVVVWVAPFLVTYLTAP